MTFPVYSLVTNNGYCRVNGTMPYYCSKRPMNANECEAECTKYKPCVGYEYRERSSLCYLIPSSMSCPANYTIGSLSITPASSNDLEAYEQPGTVCYGKNIGNINMLRL